MRDAMFRSLMMVFVALILGSCGPKHSSGENGLDGLENCSGLFGKQYNDCLTKAYPKLQDDGLVTTWGIAGGHSLKSNMGSVMAIKYAGNYYDCKALEKGKESARQCNYVESCLAVRNGRGVWEPCNNYSIEQQFHFINRDPIRFSLHPDIIHEGLAFQVATRASVMSTYRPGTSETDRDFLCLQPHPDKVSLVKCDAAVYFTTLMNRHDDDDDLARTKGGQYVSLVALVGQTPTLAKHIEKESKKMDDDIGAYVLPDAQKDEVATRNKEAIRANRKFINLGSFADNTRCNAFRLLANAGGKAIGKCPSQEIREEQNNLASNHLFVHSCGDPNFDKGADCTGLDPIKNYYDFAEAQDWGMVVKLSPKGGEKNCLQVSGGKIHEIEHCDQNSVDNESIQFRAETVVSEELKNGKSKVRLRSLLNPSLCADLAGDKLVACTKAPHISFDPVNNDLIVRKGNEWQSYFMTTCLVATSHKKVNRYDCQREIPWRYDLYEKLSIGLAFVPILGPVFATVFDGMLCDSNEERYAENGCIGVGLDISLGILMGDFLPLGNLGLGILKAVTKGGAKAGGAMKTGLSAVSSSARTAIRQAAVRSGHSKLSYEGTFLAMNKNVITALTQKDFTVQRLLATFQRSRAANNCGGASCAGWWNPAPRPGEETNVYLKQLYAYVAKSQMPQKDKNIVLTKLKQAIK